MLETTKRLEGTINEIVELITKQLSASNIATMSTDEFKLLQLTIKLIDDSNELMIETAEKMESIERKLDELLKRSERV